MLWALIENDLSAIIRVEMFTTSPNSVGFRLRRDSGRPYWVPVVVEEIDTSTGPDVVRSPMIQSIEETRVLRQRIIRDMTAQEIADEDAALLANAMAEKGLMRAIFRRLLSHENRIRDLNSAPNITMQQMLDAMLGDVRP